MSVPNQAIIQEFDYAPCDVENIYAKAEYVIYPKFKKLK